MCKPFDFITPVSYQPERKAAFLRTARARLRGLATMLGLEPGTYDIRTNIGGIAVSGEVTLHSDSLYIQAAQSWGRTSCLLIRSCEGRRDYSGGPNRFLPLSLLNDIPLLARVIKANRMAHTPHALDATCHSPRAFARALSARL